MLDTERQIMQNFFIPVVKRHVFECYFRIGCLRQRLGSRILKLPFVKYFVHTIQRSLHDRQYTGFLIELFERRKKIEGKQHTADKYGA